MTPSLNLVDSPLQQRTQRLNRLRSALFFVAACALFSGASAQITLKNATPTGAVASAIVQTDQVRAELVAHAPDGLGPNKSVWLGLKISHQPQWHTYWKNPGDSGLPTTLQWTLPQGMQAGEIAWPAPDLIKVGSMGNYGYGDTVLLPVPVVIAKTFQPADAAPIHLTASWLVCRQECIPQEANFVLRLPVRGSTAAHGSEFETAFATAPKSLSDGAQARVDAKGIALTVPGLPTGWQGKSLQIFPESANIADPSTSPQTQSWEGAVWKAVLPLSSQREVAPGEFPLVLALEKHSVRTVATVSGNWPALPGADAAHAAPGADVATSATVPTVGHALWSTWVVAMAAALLGGLILNLMPCVLPVLAIKVLGFSQRPGHPPTNHRTQGIAYTAGVVLSFMALGALMLALRATGEQLGWGFQLQSPAVLAVLATLFTLIGLNLAGLFEVGSLLPHQLASLQARHPVVDAFLSGVLAVAIASPCTAPFMGASLGYAITLPATQAMGIFAALGLGLALPFLLIAWAPALGRWLPQPGAWMDTLRRFMAFPMFATVVWLVWVLGHLSGVDGAASLLALLVALSLLVWSASLEGRTRLIFASISVAACAALTGAIGQNVLHIQEAEAPASTVLWQPWAPGRVETELANGHPVFVDFTAAWCITCQYNKKTTLGHADVLTDFQRQKVTLLRADWTRRDPAITQALEKLGRNGVPVYVLYQSGKAPILFSEILNKQDLRDAIATL
jgi:thiol:disulfide interchange protein DsbD